NGVLYLLNLQDALAAADAGAAGTDGLQNRGAVDRIDEGIQLGLVAGQLDRVGLVGDVDDAAAEDIRSTLHFFTFLADGTDLDQHQFALDERAFGQIDDLDDFDQAVQVLGDLLDHVIRAAGDDGHARQRGILGRRHGQRFDIVRTGREQTDHARQGARFVFQQYRNDMAHHSSSEPSSISVRPLPVLTIGQTFSVWSVMIFMNTRRSFMSNAAFSAPSRSPGLSTVMPTWP